MAPSVMRDINGPDWPLGNIVVAVPGTPVNIMSLVDPALGSAPEKLLPSPLSGEYSIRCWKILFQPYKVGAGPPAFALNTGNIYVVRAGVTPGVGNKTDTGAVIAILPPGALTTPPPGFMLDMPANTFNTLNPYRYFIDADTAADACQVTLIIAG